MKRTLSPEERRRLEAQIMEIFKNETHALSQELQRILADDLVTAFENRLATLVRIHSRQGG